MLALKIAAWVSVIVGFFYFASALRAGTAQTGAALGLFLIFLGINAFTAIRIAKLEETIKGMKDKR
jgi:ABC-type transport system involved in cytochrome bd biosynthesis fused ATPase/permease subunit